MRAVTKWTKRARFLRLSRYIILICLFLSLAIVGLTYYGTNVGNFLITIEEQAINNLSLSETSTFIQPRSMLKAEGLKHMKDATLTEDYIPSNIHNIAEGSHNDKKNSSYIAYTFYLKNVSAVAVEYEMEIVINQISKNGKYGVDSALRVMVIRNGERNIYAKWQEEDDIGEPEQNNGLYQTTNFLSEYIVCREKTEVFNAGEVAKYTVVMWLEGWDKQCTDEIKGDTIKMEMKFRA